MPTLVILLILLISLLGSALFFWLWKRHSKGRVALATISAISALFAAFLTVLSVNPIVFIGNFLAGESISQAVAQAQPNTIHVIIAAIVCILLAFYIYRAGTRIVVNWDGPITQSIADLYDGGQQDKILPIALKELEYFYYRRPNPVVATGGAPPLQLADPPGERPWRLMAVDLLKLDNRDIEISEQGWSDTASAWIGHRVEPLSGVSKKVLVFVHVAKPNLSEVGSRINKLINQQPDSAQQLEVIVCVEEDDDYDYEEALERGIGVRFVSKSHLLLASLELGEYCRNLIKRFERDLVPGTNFSLLDCYLPLKLHACDESSYGNRTRNGDTVDFDSLIEEWLARNDRQHLVIAGEYGQGKSTALLALCARWARHYLQSPTEHQHRIPLLIELRGRSPSRQGLAELLNEWGMRFDLKGEALLNLVRAGRAVVIFEGFDEVQDAGRLYDRFRHFDRLWQFAFPMSKLIFTGRPNFFVTDPEMRRLLRIDEAAAAAGRAYTKRYDLAFLDEAEEISHVLRAFPRAVRDEVLDTYRSDERFAEIASRPSMLPIIGSQWDNLKSERQRTGELTNGQIIKYFIDFLYERKEAEIERDSSERGIAPEDNFILMPRMMKHYFTLGIVRKMVASDSRNTISRPDFRRCVELLWEDFPAVFRSGDLAADYELIARKLNERFKDFTRAEVVESVATDVRANGIFVTDPASGEGNLCLPHKQYYEFLIAESMLFSLSDPRKPLARAWERCSYLSATSWGPFKTERYALYHFADIANAEWLKQYFFNTSKEGLQRRLAYYCNYFFCVFALVFDFWTRAVFKKSREGENLTKKTSVLRRLSFIFIFFTKAYFSKLEKIESFLFWRSFFVYHTTILFFAGLLIVFVISGGALSLSLAITACMLILVAISTASATLTGPVFGRYLYWSACCLHRFQNSDAIRAEFGNTFFILVLFVLRGQSWLSRKAQTVVESDIDEMFNR